jgi:hypothetical protein
VATTNAVIGIKKPIKLEYFSIKNLDKINKVAKQISCRTNAFS